MNELFTYQLDEMWGLPEEESEMDIGSYKIIDYGIDHTQFFPGITTAFNPDYEHCCYGIGETYSEALDDALEMMVGQDENTRQLTEHIAKEEFFPGMDDLRTRVDHDDHDEPCELYYHVGIMWNL